MVWQELVQEFLIGGFLVAVALFFGMQFGPIIAGVIATLPIRLGSTLLLGGAYEGKEFAMKMVEGSLLTYVGTFLFLVVLFFGIPRIGIMRSFVAAAIVCFVTIVIMFKATGRL